MKDFPLIGRRPAMLAVGVALCLLAAAAFTLVVETGGCDGDHVCVASAAADR